MVFPTALPQSSRRIVVGDVHGHYTALQTLLTAIAPGANDAVYFIGDLIDRGPDSAKVVELVLENKFHCLLGNHEQMMLDAVGGGQVSPQLLQSWLYTGGLATLTSYNHHIPSQHINWLQSLPLYLDLGDVWLVHAGLDPQLPLQEQNHEQFCWIRERFHRSTQPYFSDKLIITGHTITFTFPRVEPGKLAMGAGWLDIDTGAYHPRSGWLTALELNERQVYQVHTNTQRVRKLALDEAVVVLDPNSLQGKPSKSKSWFGR